MTTGAVCSCPDPWCRLHAQHVCGARMIIDDDDGVAFCPACGHDGLPVGVCGGSRRR